MKIKYDYIHEYWLKGKYLPFKWCCDEFKEDCAYMTIDLDVPSGGIKLSEDIGEYYTFPFVFRYCPYCGEKIELEQR